jgi:hypothetical protein
MTEFSYQLSIREKILLIRDSGFVIVPRAEAEAVFDVPEDETGSLVIYSPEWLMGRNADGMVMSGDDASLLEAEFAEAFSDDSWADIPPAEFAAAMAGMEKSMRRKHLRVVE